MGALPTNAILVLITATLRAGKVTLFPLTIIAMIRTRTWGGIKCRARTIWCILEMLKTQ